VHNGRSRSLTVNDVSTNNIEAVYAILF